MSSDVLFNLNVSYKQLGEDIFVIENFLEQDKFETIQNILLELKNSDWSLAPEDSYFYGRWSKPIKESELILQKTKEIIKNDYTIGKTSFFTRMLKGQFHGIHSDNNDYLQNRELSKSLMDNEPYSLEDDIRWGTILYLNDFSGGSIRYTKQNIIYHPKPNEFIVHSSEDHCEHEVLEVTSDLRLSHANYIFKQIKVPIRDKESSNGVK